MYYTKGLFSSKLFLLLQHLLLQCFIRCKQCALIRGDLCSCYTILLLVSMPIAIDKYQQKHYIGHSIVGQVQLYMFLGQHVLSHYNSWCYLNKLWRRHNMGCLLHFKQAKTAIYMLRYTHIHIHVIYVCTYHNFLSGHILQSQGNEWYTL